MVAVPVGIGAAAAALGISPRALRYYEQIKLIAPSTRTAGGLRRYTAPDLARIRRIRELQDLMGFNLDEIRAILEREDQLDQIRQSYRATPAGSAKRRSLLTAGLTVREDLVAQVRTKIERLEAFQAELLAAAERVRTLLEET